MVVHDKDVKLRAIASLSGFKHTTGNFTLTRDIVVPVEIPENFASENMQRLLNDAEGIATRLRENPEEMKDLLETTFRGDLHQARQIAKKLKLTEEDFTAEGGGLIGFIILVIVLLCALEGTAE